MVESQFDSSNNNNDTDEEEEEEANDLSDADLDEYMEIVGTWERGNSRSRRTVHESLEIRLKDWTHGLTVHCDGSRMMELLIERLLKRAIGSRPPPLLVGFALQPAGWERPYHIPLRSPSQNTAAAMAAALLRMADEYEGVNLFDGTCRTKVNAVWALDADLSSNNPGLCFALLIFSIYHNIAFISGFVCPEPGRSGSGGRRREPMSKLDFSGQSSGHALHGTCHRAGLSRQTVPQAGLPEPAIPKLRHWPTR